MDFNYLFLDTCNWSMPHTVSQFLLCTYLQGWCNPLQDISVLARWWRRLVCCCCFFNHPGSCAAVQKQLIMDSKKHELGRKEVQSQNIILWKDALCHHSDSQSQMITSFQRLLFHSYTLHIYYISGYHNSQINYLKSHIYRSLLVLLTISDHFVWLTGVSSSKSRVKG